VVLGEQYTLRNIIKIYFKHFAYRGKGLGNVWWPS